MHMRLSQNALTSNNHPQGVVVTEVPYDPKSECLFFGEEMAMAARLWTHGNGNQWLADQWLADQWLAD